LTLPPAAGVQLSRFTLAFEKVTRNNAILGMLDWTEKNIVFPMESERESTVLLPTVINALGKNFHTLVRPLFFDLW
jgi:hypothetical protein